MSLLSMMFGGCCSGYGVQLPAVYGQICRNAMFQTAFSSFGIFGGGFDYGFGTPYVGQTHSGEQEAPAVTKEQVENARKNFENQCALLEKIQKYKNNNSEAEKTKLETSRTNAYSALTENQAKIVALTNELTPLAERLIVLQNNVDKTRKDKNDLNPLHQEIQALQAEIRAKKDEIEAEEAKTAELQKAYDDADLELKAYECAQEADEAKIKQLEALKEEAYTEFLNLNNQYTLALFDDGAENSKRQDRAHDKEKSGRWWDRAWVNPQNWTNLNFKGQKDLSADVAKCLRKLNNKGRDVALKFAQEKGLITINGNVATTTHPELKDLCDLYTEGFSQRYGEDS